MDNDTMQLYFTKYLSQNYMLKFHLFQKILFTYLREREQAQAGRAAEGEGEGEADSPLCREPNVGLDPRML